MLKAVSSFREYVTDGGSDFAASMLRDNYGLKAAYLEENGTHIGKIEKQVENDLGFQEGRIDKYVYDSYWRVATLYTTADKYSRKIMNLKKTHDERIQKIREDQRERVAKLREEQKQALEQTREKYRKRLDDQ